MTKADEKRKSWWKLATVGALFCLGGVTSCEPTPEAVEPALKSPKSQDKTVGEFGYVIFLTEKQVAELDIRTSEVERGKHEKGVMVTLIPFRALRDGEVILKHFDVPHVFVRHSVKVGKRHGTMGEIENSLFPGDEVVVNAVDKLFAMSPGPEPKMKEALHAPHP
jgi:hypothetical protein